MRRWRYCPAGDLGLTPGERLRSTHRENGLAGSLVHQAACSALHLMLRGHQNLEVIGREWLPTRPPLINLDIHF